MAVVTDPDARATRDGYFEVRELAVEYVGSSGRLLALDGLTLSVATREFVAIVGPSGCGKSSLLKVGCGLIHPTRGTVSLSGHSPAQARKEHKVGIVFQTPIMLPWRTVLANARLGLEIAGERAKRPASVERMLKLVGLDGFSEATPAELSGGMLQRVAIARALVLEPELLFMDEPFGALDEFTRAQLGQELLRIWAEVGCTILFVTHSIEEAVTLADRIIVLSDRPGRVLGEVTVTIERPRDATVLETETAFIIGRKVRQLLRDGVRAGVGIVY